MDRHASIADNAAGPRDSTAEFLRKIGLPLDDSANRPTLSQLIVEADNIAKAVGRLALLPQGKNRNQSSIKIVRRGISLLKTADLLFGEDAASVRELNIRLTTTLSKIHIPEDDPSVARLGDILNHYRAKWLADDKELAAKFEQYRADYLSNPDDRDIAIRYGWLLHDCLQAACKRLLNVKLTEFFLKQFEDWRYLGEVNEGIEKLLATRKKDIESAKDFLFSPVDAQRLYKEREWHKAIVACEFFLSNHPENASAWQIRANAHLQLLLEAKKSGDASQLANQTALFLDAASEFATHIPSSEEAAKLVLDAVSERYWILAKTAKNPPAGKEQKVTFLCNSLIKAFLSLSQVFGMLMSDEADNSTQRRCVDTATRLVDAIYWEVTRHPYKNSNKKAFADISVSFVSLIQTWGLDSLTKEDRDWHASGSRSRPLAARIVLALLACLSLGDAADIVEANPWLLRFCETEANLFKDEPSSYCSHMAKAMIKLGENERARSYALQVVRRNQTEKWRWRLLASTFPQDSQEQKDCLFIDNKEKLGVILPLLKRLRPDIANSQEKTITEQRERAFSLLAMDAKNLPGIVISCFAEGQGSSSHNVGFSHKQFIRVWWRDDNGQPCFDFIPRESMGSDNLTTGAPVLVTVSKSLGKAKAVNVEPRKEGHPFDIYPYATGVVIARNESRHYLNVAYGIGKNCNIDTKRFQSANILKDGSLCKVALFERECMPPIVLDIKCASKEDVRPSFSKVFSGILIREKGRRDAHIGDILVPASLFGRDMLDHEVRGIAVAKAKAEAEDPIWIAVSCKKTLNDLEVSP